MNYNALMIIPLWEFNGGDHAQNSRAERKKTTYLLPQWGQNGHGVTFNNLFVTSKKQNLQFSNSPIHQFTNLKFCKMSFKSFKIKKQGLKCFLK